jgi:hypothetical protein
MSGLTDVSISTSSSGSKEDNYEELQDFTVARSKDYYSNMIGLTNVSISSSSSDSEEDDSETL